MKQFLIQIYLSFQYFFLFKKPCLKMFTFKRGWTELYVFFQQSQKFLLTDLPKLRSQYSTYFCLELPPHQKGTCRVCPVFVKHSENEVHRFSDRLRRIWFKRFYWHHLVQRQGQI